MSDDSPVSSDRRPATQFGGRTVHRPKAQYVGVGRDNRGIGGDFLHANLTVEGDVFHRTTQ